MNNSEIYYNGSWYKKGLRGFIFYKTVDERWVKSNSQLEMLRVFNKNLVNSKGLMLKPPANAGDKRGTVTKESISDLMSVMVQFKPLTRPEMFNNLHQKYSIQCIYNMLKKQMELNKIACVSEKRKCIYSRKECMQFVLINS